MRVPDRQRVSQGGTPLMETLNIQLEREENQGKTEPQKMRSRGDSSRIKGWEVSKAAERPLGLAAKRVLAILVRTISVPCLG